jgi:hypothetical protein
MSAGEEADMQYCALLYCVMTEARGGGGGRMREDLFFVLSLSLLFLAKANTESDVIKKTNDK